MSGEPKCRWCGHVGPYKPGDRVPEDANEYNVRTHEGGCAVGERIIANARAALTGLLAQERTADDFRAFPPDDAAKYAYEFALALETRHMKGRT